MAEPASAPGQLRHASARLVALVRGLKVLAGHLPGSDMPSSGQKWPAGQGLQPLALARSWNVPAPHIWHLLVR